MTSVEIAARMIDALEATGIPYMIVGSFSSSFYSVPRSTKDLDVVIDSTPEHLSNLKQQLPPDFLIDPQMTFESVTGTHRHTIRAAGTGFDVELFHLSDDPHDVERFRRRLRVDLGLRKANLPTAEDVIVTKLRWAVAANRAKDIADVQSVIAAQNTVLDWQYIERWCDRHGSREMLEQIRQTLFP